MLLADSDHEWQHRLSTLINSEPDMIVSGVVATKETAIQASMQLQIDVMVLDVMLNSTQQEGLDTITEVLHKKELPIIALSSLDDREIIIDEVSAGTINFIRKSNYLDIISAIEPNVHEKQIKYLLVSCPPPFSVRSESLLPNNQVVHLHVPGFLNIVLGETRKLRSQR